LHTITRRGQLVAPAAHSSKSQSAMLLHSIRQLAPSVQLALHVPEPLQRTSQAPFPLQTGVQRSATRQSIAQLAAVHLVRQLATSRQSTSQALPAAQVMLHVPGVSSQSRSQSQPPQE
jgi:hypothetical protein